MAHDTKQQFDDDAWRGRRECVRQMMRLIALVVADFFKGTRQNIFFVNFTDSRMMKKFSRNFHLIRSCQEPLDVNSCTVINHHRQQCNIVYFSYSLFFASEVESIFWALEDFFVALAVLLIIVRNSSTCSRSQIMMTQQHVSDDGATCFEDVEIDESIDGHIF